MLTKAWDLSCADADFKKEKKRDILAVEQSEGRQKKCHTKQNEIPLCVVVNLYRQHIRGAFGL
jgi:hypothetical protein